MKICSNCRQECADDARFCTRCGRYIYGEPIVARAEPAPVAVQEPPARVGEQMHLPSLYLMAAVLIIAVVFPPWETPPGQPPEFLGFNFIMSPPRPDAVISRMLMTIEATTIGVAGLYVSWLLRNKR